MKRTDSRQLGWEGAGIPAETEIVEVELLLPARQAAALEASAHRAGVTAAAMVRRLIGNFLNEAERETVSGRS